MLYWNTWEALGEAAAALTNALGDAACALVLAELPPSYGDGRMAPYEWLRTTDGTLLKTDCTGNVWDHTAVGPQSVAWDIAGAIVEWGLDDERASALLEAFHQAKGPPLSPVMLQFYGAAYAAFRAGQCHLCAGMSAHDPEEAARLWGAHSRYRDTLAWLLESGGEERN
jgi:hypothetical protein